MGNLRKFKKDILSRSLDLKLRKKFIKDNPLSKIILYTDVTKKDKKHDKRRTKRSKTTTKSN